MDVPARSNDTFISTKEYPLRGRTSRPQERSRFIMQENSLPHLDWPSGLPYQKAVKGTYYNFEKFMMDDHEGRVQGDDSPIIYIMDLYFNRNHRVCISPPTSTTSPAGSPSSC